MRVLILGAGQLGRALLGSRPTDADVTILDLPDVDITDAASVAAAFARARPALVFNAAAYTAVDRAEEDRDTAFAVNAAAPAIIANIARDAGARMIHVSTDFVFDGTAHLPYPPDAIPAPLGVYGESKAAGDAAVVAAGGDALIVRTAWVYAAEGANFVLTMLRLMAERDQLNVVDDQIGSPTHAASLARALWTLATGTHRGILHFTDAGVASWYDFAVAIRDEGLRSGLLTRPCTVSPIPTAAYPTPARRPAYSVLDKAETWRLLGGPARHWRAELTDMIDQRKRLLDG